MWKHRKRYLWRMVRQGVLSTVVLNKKRLWRLLDEVTQGNFRALARLLGVQVSHLHKVLNTESKAGPVMLGKLMAYCKEHEIPFEEFILDQAQDGKAGQQHAEG